MGNIRVEARPRTARVFELLEKNGNQLGMPLSKSIGNKLFELRILGHDNLRFIYTFHQGCVWILNGFEKKTNKILKREMDYSRQQLKILLQK